MSSQRQPETGAQGSKTPSDAAIAVRFMLIKAGIFILIPIIASVVAVWLTLK